MQLSVVILNYNVRSFLELCLQSVVAATKALDAEIIVVDNASPDGSVRMVGQQFPEVKLIENQDNCGFPRGNNIGVAQAKGEYICILNPDTIVAEDTFHKVLQFARQKQDLGIVGVKLIDGTGNYLPESKRGLPTPWVAFTKFMSLYKLSKRYFGKYYASHVNDTAIGEVDVLVGAFMFMKRTVYKELGGFDERYFMYGEDIDLSYAVQQKGLKNYYFGQTTIIHFKGESTVKDVEYLRRFKEGMDLFYNKHFKKKMLFDIFMQIGIERFSGSKLRKKELPERTPETIMYLGEVSEHSEVLRKKYGDRLVESDPTVLDTLGHQATLVFDGSQYSYKEIIQMWETHKNKGLTYRIWPKGCNFMLGSDSADSRGEVVFF